jgi:D-glycero-D-manno-heptose 1,7-bisphosphate phosphatase
MKAIFFDRDGIVNIRIIGDYVKNIEEFRFNPHFTELFTTIRRNKLAILITNQQGIGKGLMSEADLAIVHNFMQTELLRISGSNFDDIYFSPALESENSPMRKPNPGMILVAMDKWGISAEGSWMIGDSTKDHLAGKRAGLRTILIGEFDKALDPSPDYIFPSIGEFFLNIPNELLD